MTRSPEEAALLIKACLLYLKSHLPSMEAHCDFVKILVKLGEMTPLNKPLKLALWENEAILFGNLFEGENLQLALNLAYVLKQNNIPLSRKSLCHLFSMFPETPDVSRKKMYFLFKNTSHEEIVGIDSVDVSKTCKILLLAYINERFDISLDLFTRYSDITAVDDKLFLNIFTHFPSHLINKYDHFIALSQRIKNPSLELAAGWNKLFRKLFLDGDSSLDIQAFEALEKIFGTPDLLMMMDQENLNLMIFKILKANPLSPRFGKCLKYAFTLIQKGTEESLLVEYSKKLPFCKDAKQIEDSFTYIAKQQFISLHDCQECWLSLLKAMLKVRSKKFRELITQKQKQFLTIFDPNEACNVEAYKLLLQGAVRLLRRGYSPSVFDSLRQIVHKFIPFQNEQEMLKLDGSILLPYAECLSMSPKLQNQGRSFLIKIAEKHFTAQGKNWDPLVKSFKTMISRIQEDTLEGLPKLVELLFHHPQPELCLLLAEKLYALNPAQYIALIGELLNNSLSDYALLLPFYNNTQKENWILNALTDISLHPHSSVSDSGLKCIQNPFIGLVIPPKKLIAIREEILLACLRNRTKEFKVSKIEYDDLLNYASKIINQLEKREEIQNLFNRYCCYCWLKSIFVKTAFIHIHLPFNVKNEILDIKEVHIPVDEIPEKKILMNYSFYHEILNFSVFMPPSQKLFLRTIQEFSFMLSQNKSQPVHLYTLILGALVLEQLYSQFSSTFELFGKDIKFITSDFPLAVRKLVMEDRNNDDKKLSLFKNIFLISFQISRDEPLQMDYIEFRKTLNQFMEMDNKDYIVMMAYKLFINACNIPGFFESQEVRCEMVKKFFSFASTMEGGGQAFLFANLSDSFIAFNNLIQSQKSLKPLIKNCAFHCLEQVIHFINRKNLSFLELQNLVAYFPEIIDALFKHDFSCSEKEKFFHPSKLSNCYNSFKESLETWLKMETINGNNLMEANESLYSMIKKMPIKSRVQLVNEWLNALLTIGQKTKREDLFLVAARSLFENAMTEKLYLKEEELETEARSIVKLEKPRELKKTIPKKGEKKCEKKK